MSYTIDEKLKEGMALVEKGDAVKGASLINEAAVNGTTRGKSYFEIGEMIRLGKAGLQVNLDDSARFYDTAMSLFKKQEKLDSLDYREMGDYYNYGYGTEPVDKNKALEYYDLAWKDGDEVAKERADEIRASLEKGSSEVEPSLTKDTVAPETKPEEKTAVAAPASAPVHPVEKAPVVTSLNQPVDSTDKIINDEIDADQILIRVIRLLDSVSASQQEKKDAVELCKAASDDGSLRASVLMGYLYEGDNGLVERDYDKSKAYYEKAIEKGSSSAFFRLGILYTDEEASFYDVEKGHEMILESAHKGYSFALCYLGDCFRVKVNDPKNLETAYRYYALSGERGLGLAYHNMAEIDASRQQLGLAAQHEKLAFDNGYDPNMGYQDPLFYSLHI